MEYIEAPEKYSKSLNLKSVFLAGGITDCPDWQSEIVKLLNDIDVALLNPRRKNFPINNPNASRGQIKWEFDHLRKADIILFWFPAESVCPIALYELGAWCMTNKPISLGMAAGYQRKIDIQEQLALVRPEIKIVYALDKLAEQTTNLIKR
jgi:hypothetical protein